MGAQIKNIAYYLPEKILTNSALQLEFPDWDSKGFESKVGIFQRHIADENQTAVDLAEKAALKLIQDYEIDINSIDGLVFCTQSPDYFLPTSACILQNRLKLRKNIPAFDFNLGCSGYVYGLSIIKGLVESKLAKRIIFLTADTYSKFINKRDVINRAIFGDAGTATLIEHSDLNKIFHFVLGTDGEGANNLIVKNGAMRNKFDSKASEIRYANINTYTDNDLYMNGPEIFNFTIQNVPNLIKDVMSLNHVEDSQIDFYVYHQANKFMLEYLRRKSDIATGKFYINLTNTGNTVSGTIPIALQQMKESKILLDESQVLLAGFGVGYSWGATIIKI